MLYHAIVGCVLTSLAVVAGPVSAADRLTAAELEKRCRVFIESPAEPEGEVCIAFVQGFLAGLRTAEERQVTVLAERKEESFAERAARTRAGWLIQHFRSLQGNEYCVPADVSGAEALQRVTAYLAAYEDGRNSNRKPLELVHSALEQIFPCADD